MGYIDVEQRLQGDNVDATIVDVELVVDFLVNLLLSDVIFAVDRVVDIQHAQIDELADDLDAGPLRQPLRSRTLALALVTDEKSWSLLLLVAALNELDTLEIGGQTLYLLPSG